MPRGSPVKPVRVDRGTPLGNPYVVQRHDPPEVRRAACAAFRELLSRRDVRWGDGEAVVAIGEEHGLRGEVRGWCPELAEERLGEIACMARVQRVRLDCHCCPLECHAYAIAERLTHEVCPGCDE